MDKTISEDNAYKIFKSLEDYTRDILYIYFPVSLHIHTKIVWPYLSSISIILEEFIEDTETENSLGVISYNTS